MSPKRHSPADFTGVAKQLGAQQGRWHVRDCGSGFQRAGALSDAWRTYGVFLYTIAWPDAKGILCELLGRLPAGAGEELVVRTGSTDAPMFARRRANGRGTRGRTTHAV
jgi:hypothetical protein